jgi:hypothetical protein
MDHLKTKLKKSSVFRRLALEWLKDPINWTVLYKLFFLLYIKFSYFVRTILKTHWFYKIGPVLEWFGILMTSSSWILDYSQHPNTGHPNTRYSYHLKPGPFRVSIGHFRPVPGIWMPDHLKAGHLVRDLA